jgi:hypothetical protein
MLLIKKNGAGRSNFTIRSVIESDDAYSQSFN